MQPENEQARPQKQGSFWKELLYYALFALVIVVPVRMWVAQPFVVNGDSMDATFANGEYLIVDEISYHFHEPSRGDVLIFRYPQDPSKYFIKRLIGLPGETIVVKSDSVTVMNKENPQGVRLNEPYIHSRTFGNLTETLGPDEYFVMGDNRLVSSDSRVWGPLPKSDLIGRPFVRLLPFSKIGLWPGEAASSTMFDTLEKAQE
ncbi:MAG TPA: signal peptidase I [Candidatus Paceibacterota bacterium]|nr:signal peptidase I [Candidatus Paceibacterota bacterium]